MAIDTSRVLVTHEQIEEMLERLSAQLNRDYAGKHLVVVGILTGAFIFTSDLIRRLTMPVTVDFMQVSSYVGEISSGVLKIKKDLSYDIEGKESVEAFVPVGAGSFVKGELKNTDEIIISIGAGLAVKKDAAGAREILSGQKDELKDSLDKMLANLQQTTDIVGNLQAQAEQIAAAAQGNMTQMG